MLDEKLLQQKADINNIILEELIPELRNPIDHLAQFLDKYQKSINSIVSRIDNAESADYRKMLMAEQISFRKNTLALLEKWVGERQILQPDQILPAFYNKINRYIDTLPVYWEQDLNPEIFKVDEGDKLALVLVKRWRRTELWLQKKHLDLRKSLEKKQKDSGGHYPTRRQRIGIKKLTIKIYTSHLIEHYAPIALQMQKNLAVCAFDIWKEDKLLNDAFRKLFKEEIDHKSFFDYVSNEILPSLAKIRKQLNASRRACQPELVNMSDQLAEMLSEQAQKSGVLEVNLFNSTLALNDFRARHLKKHYSGPMNKRHNTLFALADDWKFDQEIYLLIANAIVTADGFNESLKASVIEVQKKAKAIEVFIKQMKKEVQKSNASDFADKLNTLKDSVDNKLKTKIIPEVAETIAVQNIGHKLDATERVLISLHTSKKQKRILISGFDPTRAYADRKLHAISLSEVVNFELIPELKKSFSNYRDIISKELKSLDDQLHDLGRMVAYNLDTTSAVLEEEDAGFKSSLEDFNTGIERTLARYGDFENHLLEFEMALSQNFLNTIEEFGGELTILTDNKSVEKIKFRITKARTIYEITQITSKTRSGVLNWRERTRLHYKLLTGKLQTGLDTIRGQLGIHEIAGDISMDISDFLTLDHQKLQSVPTVYRRLFVNEPLKDKNFYFSRVEEEKKLNSAFARWHAGTFTPVLINGEKGSGISSLVNLFLADDSLCKIPSKSLLLSKRITSIAEFMDVTGKAVRGIGFAGLNDFLSYVNEQQPFVFFVDKIHFMFLRQPGGFDLLRHFFEIVSITSKSIFWISSCEHYASIYLNTTIGLHSFFPTLIQMGKLLPQDVNRIILLRHIASGYKLSYAFSENDLTNKAFQKKNDQQKKLFLEQKYFNALSKLSESNVAFVIRLWLSTIEKTDSNTIYMKSLDNLDFGFVSNLPNEVLFMMQNILLHESLTSNEVSMILNASKAQTELQLMRLKDRGILLLSGEQYLIQPLLLRQLLAVLKDNNFVH